MPNNIAVSITADVADLTAKRAIASAELKALQKDLANLANQARTTGRTPELNAALLAAGDAAAKSRSNLKLIEDQLKTYAPAAEGAAHGTSTVTREILTLFREAGRGNFTRMAGSATILAQAMGVLTPTVLAVGAGIAALAVPLALVTIAFEQGAQQLAHFENEMEATNGYAGVTISQLQALAGAQARWANEGIGAASKQLAALAASGRFTGDTLRLVGLDTSRMAELTGVSADKFVTEFEKMKDGVAKFAAEYEQQYGQLTTAQFEYIQQLEQQGRKEEAEYALAKDIYDYLGRQAPQNLGYLERAWRGVANGISSAWDGLKAFGRDSNLDKLAMTQVALDSARRWDPAGLSPAVQALEKQKQEILANEAAAQKLAAAHAQATATQKEGVAAAQKLHEQFEASKTSGQKLQAALQGINDELKKAVAADPGNKALYEKEAAAARSQAVKSDTPHGAGSNQVQAWAEQLHQQQIASNDFFGDEHDKELAFWQAKLAIVKAGSKEWLEIQAKVYEAQKAVARGAYDDLIASLDDQLEANRENWSEEQSIWAEKLAVIKLNFGEQSKEYENAHRQLEAAEREHQERMRQIAEEAAQRRLGEIKDSIKAEADIRKANESIAETKINGDAQSSGTPFAEAGAAEKLRALHQQAAQDEIADAQKAAAAEDALMQKKIDAAQAAAVAESATLDQYQPYLQAVQAKEEADQRFAEQHRVLSAQLAAQDAADAQKVQQAWQRSIESYTNSFAQGLVKIGRGQETWGQLLNSEIEQVESAFASMIAKRVASWLAAEAAQVAATAAGVTARTTAEVSGAAASRGVLSAFNEKQIIADAAKAAAGAFSAVAGVPIVGPLLAPAAAATAFGAVMAFENMASFDRGADMLPADMLALVHQGERIVPKADNAALIAAASGGGGSSGDLHLTVNNSSTVHGHGLEDVIGHVDRNSRDFIRLMEGWAKGGRLNGVFQHARGR